MTVQAGHVCELSELSDGDEADFFALLVLKEELLTREKKPYFRVAFRDSKREVAFPIWSDTIWAAECRDRWQPGVIYKLRARYQETNYGPQLEILKIREAVDSDAADGFDPAMFLARTRFDPEEMFDQLAGIALERISDETLSGLVVSILEDNRAALLTLPAATRNHHAFVGGFLEHVLCVTEHCIYLAERYADHYPDLDPPLDVDLVVAGAILHDIGKLRELEQQSTGAVYTAAGNLLGHVVQGRDLVREAAGNHAVDPEKLLRLEHVIIAHQRLPEWGSPKPPMTPEALIVHYADDLDAKYHMIYTALRDDKNPGPVTSKKNALYQKVYRGAGGREA